MTDWRALPPVPEAERPDPPTAMSQTLLSHGQKCRRSAMLYLRHRGGAPSHEMDRGSAFHEFAETAIRTLVSEGNVTTKADAAAARDIGVVAKAGGARIEHDVARAILEDVLAKHKEWTIPSEEQEALRIMVWHFAQAFEIPEGAEVLAVEQMVELDLGDWTVRGKIDYAVRLPDGIVEVMDWKTGFDLPSKDAFERKFQVPFYAVLLAAGSPVDGQGAEARRRAFPLAARAPQFRLMEVYPRRVWEDDAGPTLPYRDAYVDRSRVLDHQAFLERVVGQLDHALVSGEWPAVPGSHCGRCPARAECPLPERLRRWQGGEPSVLAERLLFAEKDRKELLAALRPIAGARGAIPLGDDLEVGFRIQNGGGQRYGIHAKGLCS